MRVAREPAAVLTAIAEALTNMRIIPFVFVDYYTFATSQEHLMMNRAMKDIERCHLPIAETSDNAIDICVEAGYAKPKANRLFTPGMWMRYTPQP